MKDKPMRNGFMRATAVTSLISLITILSGAVPAGGARAAAANAPATATLRYGIDEEANISRLPQEIALREGLFAREGLNVEVIRFTGGFRTRGTPAGNAPSVRDGMRDGTIDMSRQQLPILITETLAGGKYVGVSVTSSNPVYFLPSVPRSRPSPTSRVRRSRSPIPVTASPFGRAN
jgi:ABC-type nitrate/sulfonate/bicarbonate transport system substrate-binding protein